MNDEVQHLLEKHHDEITRLIEFVDHMFVDYVVKQVKHEYPGKPGGSRFTYYCEYCDSESETEEELEHSETCVISQWRALKREIGYAEAS